MKVYRTIAPLHLRDILSRKIKDCYHIESQYQRPFVWKLVTILNDFINVVYLFLKKRKDNEYYEYNFDTIGTSELEDVNKKHFSEEVAKSTSSILDGGHRIRLSMCLYIVLLLLKYKREDKEYLNIDDYIKVKSGEYKLDGIGGLKDDFKGFYSFINETKISDILETKDRNYKSEKIKKLFKIDTDTCEKSMKDIFYFLLYALQGKYKDEGIDELPNEFDYDYAIESVLDGIILYNENVPSEEKWDYFRNKNARGMPLADKYLYSRQLINAIQDDELREKVNISFKRFDEKCKETEEKKEYLTEYNKDVMTFVMTEMYKLFLYENNIVEYTDKKITIFSDSKLGLNVTQSQYRKLITEEEIETFFNLCHEFVDLLNQPLGNTNSDLYKTNYLFSDLSRKKNVVIWSIIAPSVFLLRKYYSNEKSEKFVFDSLLHYTLLYYLRNYLLPGSNVSWFHNGISKFNNILYTNRNSDFNVTKVRIARFLREEYNKYDKSDMIRALTSTCTLGISVSGNGKNQSGGCPFAIKVITLYSEALLIDRLNIKGNNGLNDYFTKIYNNGTSSYDLDHVFPKKKYNAALKEHDTSISIDNDYDKSKIGNFVFLEKNLNSSKGDEETKNSNIYSQSSFYSVKLLNQNNKCDLSNEKLSLIPFKRYSEEELNNPSLLFVENRTMDVAHVFINWVFSICDEYEEILNNATNIFVNHEKETKICREVVYTK